MLPLLAEDEVDCEVIEPRVVDFDAEEVLLEDGEDPPDNRDLGIARFTSTTLESITCSFTSHTASTDCCENVSKRKYYIH